MPESFFLYFFFFVENKPGSLKISRSRDDVLRVKRMRAFTIVAHDAHDVLPRVSHATCRRGSVGRTASWCQIKEKLQLGKDVKQGGLVGHRLGGVLPRRRTQSMKHFPGPSSRTAHTSQISESCRGFCWTAFLRLASSGDGVWRKM